MIYQDQFQTLLMFHLLRPDRVYFNRSDAAADEQESRRLVEAAHCLTLVGPTAPAESDEPATDESGLKRAA